MTLNLIKDSLSQLINSELPKTQMEIYYNEQIVLQVFNIADVKKWNLKIPLRLEDGILLDIFFHKKKKHNRKYFSRFKKSSFFQEFVLVETESGKIRSYYSIIPENITEELASEKIFKIINEICHLKDGKPVDILVRAFE